jgi:DNA-binding GntR family transcriptional regulator
LPNLTAETADHDMSSLVPEDHSSEEGLGDQACNQLIGMMLSGDLPAGTRLQERKLSAILEVSRTPLRQAFGKLEARGLIARRDGHFTTIDGLDVKLISDTYALRRMVEVDFAEKAAGKFSLKLAETLRFKSQELLKVAGVTAGEIWSLDDELHGAIADAAGNSFAAALCLNWRIQTHVFCPQRSPDRLKSDVLEHLALIDALALGDATRARRLMETHLASERSATISAVFGTSIFIQDKNPSDR